LRRQMSVLVDSLRPVGKSLPTLSLHDAHAAPIMLQGLRERTHGYRLLLSMNFPLCHPLRLDPVDQQLLVFAQLFGVTR